MVSILTSKTFNEMISQMFKEIFFNIGSSSTMMESLWYLFVLPIALLISQKLLKYIYKKGKNKEALNFIIIIVLIIICKLMDKLPYLPLRLGAIPGAVLIIYLSHLYGKYIVDYSKKINWSCITIGVICLSFLAIFNKTVNIAIPKYNDFAMFLICAIMGICLTFSFANKFKLRFISFIGRNSLIIFAIHGIWLRFYSILLSFLLQDDLTFMNNIPFEYCLIGCPFVLLLSIASYYCINNFYNIYYMRLRRLLNY